MIKTDLKKGIVYGIVYSPDDVDTQGDCASAEEIVKASYEFMKSRNTLNVDKDHSFEVEKAFVCESWIIKANDPLFPNEKEGTWAVGIKLEDEELKKAVKKGEIAGLSMAGSAYREQNTDSGKRSMEKSEGFSIKDLTQAIKKAFNLENKEQGDELKKEELQEVLKEATKPLHEEIATLKKNVEDLAKEKDEMKQELKKSKQRDDFRKKDEETNDYEGVL